MLSKKPLTNKKPRPIPLNKLRNCKGCAKRRAWLKKLLTGSLILLVGCGGFQTKPTPEPEIIIRTQALDCGTPPQRPPINLRPITWKIIGDRFTLTPEGYEDLSYNVSGIWLGVEQLIIEVEYYESCLEKNASQP